MVWAEKCLVNVLKYSYTSASDVMTCPLASCQRGSGASVLLRNLFCHVSKCWLAWKSCRLFINSEASFHCLFHLQIMVTGANSNTTRRKNLVAMEEMEDFLEVIFKALPNPRHPGQDLTSDQDPGGIMPIVKEKRLALPSYTLHRTKLDFSWWLLLCWIVIWNSVILCWECALGWLSEIHVFIILCKWWLFPWCMDPNPVLLLRSASHWEYSRNE